MIRRWITGLLICGFCCAVSAVDAMDAQPGNIRGVVGLIGPGGRFHSGDQVTLLLVARPVAVPPTESIARMGPNDRSEALNRAHMAFFLGLRQALTDPQFRLADTVADAAGRFGFEGVPPGRYQIVVSFPALIQGEKTTWQVPVRVRSGKTALVSLDNGNHLFPLSRHGRLPDGSLRAH
jgi:hypothetical protein